MRAPAALPAPPDGRTGWPWTSEPAELPNVMTDGRPWPRITIVTPSLNQGAFLEPCIRSVALQAYPAVDHLVIDGGSTDDSLATLQRYAPWLSRWVSEPDRGQSHAINKGFDGRRGSICAWLNADDFLMPGALAEIARMSIASPEAPAWVGGCHRVRPDGSVLSVIMPRGLTRAGIADWSGEGFFYQPACFIASHAIDAVGPLDEQLHLAFDLDWWLRLSAIGPFAATSEALASATIHAGAKTQRRRLEMHAEIIAVQVRHGFADLAARKLGALLAAQRFGSVRRLHA